MNLSGAIKNHQGKTARSVQHAVTAAAMFYSANQGKTDLTSLIYDGAAEFLRIFIYPLTSWRM